MRTPHLPHAQGRSHRLPSPHPPLPIARPPPPKQLTSLQLPRQWVVVRWYQGTDVPSYPAPRWEGSATRLHPALLRSSMGRSSQHARGSRKMACPVQPRPEACLPPLPIQIFCYGHGYGLATHTMHIPCLIHANRSSSYNRRCRQFKATTLAYWRTHLERTAPHRTGLDLTSPHLM